MGFNKKEAVYFAMKTLLSEDNLLLSDYIDIKKIPTRMNKFSSNRCRCLMKIKIILGFYAPKGWHI